ncbi:hypothetical protein EBESD8_19380 [Rhodococcus aetherivorans]|nr:hypothetical protein EBESD8_19380 [Rhodococcus aetherivorans]
MWWPIGQLERTQRHGGLDPRAAGSMKSDKLGDLGGFTVLNVPGCFLEAR